MKENTRCGAKGVNGIIPIPNAALDDRLGFIGTSGSGKTYNAGGAVERLLHKHARVVIVDPLGVWWGLRLLADGKTQSRYDVAIFGGAHGDLPLNEHAGALIGETAATMAESCIIDISQLGTKSAERRFMTGFLETIYRKANGQPMHLVIDEADLFAPQKPPKGDETLLNLMEQIVRRGRVKGFIPWLISQRPAVLNKNVLSQVDGLVAFKLTSSQDRDALDGWIEGQADKAQGKAIKDELPAMQIGQGVVWVPGRGVLDTVTFPPKETFDSSRAPKRGEKLKRAAALKPLDLGVLKTRLATVEAETKANDPKALRLQLSEKDREIRRLQGELTYKSTAAPAAPDKDALKAAEQKGFEQARKKLKRVADGALHKSLKTTLTMLRGYVVKFVEQVDGELDALKQHIKAAELEDVQFAPTAPAPPPAPQRMARQVQQKSVLVQRSPTPPAGDGSYTRPQMRVLRSLAMWKSLGHDMPSREMVAAVAGYSPGSGGFNNLLGGLGPKAMGAIGIPQPGRVSLETGGIDVPSVDEGRDLLLSVLSNPQKKLVAALNGAGAISREQLAEATSYSAGSGGFNNLIGSLNTLGISLVPAQGQVSLSEWAQELLSGYEVRAAA
jgi:hypothetical protein